MKRKKSKTTVKDTIPLMMESLGLVKVRKISNGDTTIELSIDQLKALGITAWAGGERTTEKTLYCSIGGFNAARKAVRGEDF